MNKLSKLQRNTMGWTGKWDKGNEDGHCQVVMVEHSAVEVQT